MLCAHFAHFFQMGMGANWTFGEEGTPSALKRYPKGLMPIFLKFLQMGTGQMGTWTNGVLGKGMPKCPKEVPQVLCAHFFQNVANGHAL